MITKFVTSLALAIVILASLALPASAQGPVDLELGGEGATSWNIGNVSPGDSGIKTVTLHNAGSKNGVVTLWVSDIVSGEGTNPKSETGDTAEPGELDHYLLLNIYCSGLDSNISLPTTIDSLPQSATDPAYIKIRPLNVGDTITLDWRWQLPVKTGNEVQGDSLSFTINYMLEEFPPTTPPPAGWWLLGPPSPSGTTDVRGMVGTGCSFLRSATAVSDDGLCQITIPEGTVALTEELECLTEITIVRMDDTPTPPKYVIGLIYDFQPSSATFEPPITLEFSYDPGDIPEGIAEEDLVIAYYDEETGEWVELECTVHPETNTITASISHFTAFAVLGYEVVPATFIPGSVAISPTEVDIEETVNVSISVANSGGMAGSYRVMLKIDGAVESVQYVTVGAGDSKKVTFTIAKDVAGSYSVDVNGLSGSFIVKAPPELPPPPAELPLVPAKGVNWPLLGGIIAGVIIVGLLIFFLVRRRAELTRQ